LKTSYYSKSGKEKNAVSIAGKAPNWYKGKQFRALAPKYWFFKKYKEDNDEKFYTEQYQKEVLDKLDPKEVFEYLGEDAILLCWEKTGKFCHRHLIADWLMKNLNIEIKEI